jgi:YebC/PmpR family DNA-binding regulatory protein
MSGHSHYSTIKRTKEAKDAKKGQMFSKLARGIQIAIKAGGGGDPDTNYKLRMAIEAAKSANMPKENVDRAISRATQEAENIEEITYEGIGPEGVGIIVETATDNRNRTGQEIKGIFERGGGRMTGLGSVLYNFDQKGLILVKKGADYEKMILDLIDAGVEDIDESKGLVGMYTDISSLSEIKTKIVNLGYSVESMSIVQKPKNFIQVSDKQKVEKIIKLIEYFEEHDDVQNVYSNLEFPEGLLD